MTRRRRSRSFARSWRRPTPRTAHSGSAGVQIDAAHPLLYHDDGDHDGDEGRVGIIFWLCARVRPFQFGARVGFVAHIAQD